MYSFLQRNIFLFLLFLISFVGHWYIFFDTNDLNAGDWVYHFSSTLSDLKNYHIYASSYGLGTVSVFANNWIFYGLYYLISFFDIGWDLGTRILFLFPIIFFTPFFSFRLFYKILKNKWAAFFASLVYCFNTFFLKLQLDWLTYAFLWWILPAVLLSAINYLETKKIKYLAYNAMLVFFGIAYELRIMLLVIFSLILFQALYLVIGNAVLRDRVKDFLYICLSVGVGVLGHAFWIIPILTGNVAKDVMSNASPTPFVSFYDILDVLTLHMYSWSQNFVLEAFIKQPIDWRHFLIPIFSFIGLITYLYNKEKYDNNARIYFTFFGSILVLFVFLGKQELLPLQDLYGWAFYNIPLFNLYRESSKFLILVAFSLAYFFGIGLFWLFKILVKKHSKKTAISFAFIVSFFATLFNLQHFFDQKIGGMTQGIVIHNDYNILEEKLSEDISFSRILWNPTKPRFGFYSQYHPFVNTIDLPVIYDKYVNFSLFDRKLPIEDEVMFLLKQGYSHQLLNLAAIQYIVIPVLEYRERRTSIDQSKTVEELYEYYGKRDFFIEEMDNLPYLKRIDIGTQDLVVYENENYRPHIYATQEKETIYKDIPFEKVDFQFKNPTEYAVSLKNVFDPVYVNFSEKYHSDWKLRVGDFHWFDVLRDENYFLSEKSHFENDAKLNSFLIDPKEVCGDSNTLDSRFRGNDSKKSMDDQDGCVQNPDGSINLDLTLYFKPQSYFYLGLIVSGTTLLGCLGYLAYAWKRRS